MNLCWCIGNAWLLSLCLPASEESVGHLWGHRRIQLRRPWCLGILLGSHRPRADPVANHSLPPLSSEPVAQARHLALESCQRLMWLTHGCCVDGRGLINPCLLMHALELLILKTLLCLLAEHALPDAARVLQRLRQLTVLLLHEFVDHVMWDTILSGGLCNQYFIHLL